MSRRIHEGAGQAVPIKSRRLEQSPFVDCYRTPQTVFGVYANRYYPADNGEDVEQAYWTLRRKAALYDVPEKPVQIEGPDAVAFLERVIARSVGDLKLGRGRYALMCAPDGGLFMDGILFRLSEQRFWYVQPDGALETWLLAHSEGFDVEISDPKSRVLQLQGPTAMAIIAAASDGAIDESLGYFHSGFFDLGGQRLYVSRTGWTGELGVEIYTQGAETDCPRLWDHLMEAGEPHGVIACSLGSMEIRRIEAGILNAGLDFDGSTNPFEVGLGGVLELEKEGFVGREALLGAERGVRLFGLACDSAAPGAGDAVMEDGSAVGRATCGAWSPYLERGVGFVRFDRPGDWVGRTLSLRTPDGEERPCEIVETPFYDREKRIPRGKETAAV